MRRAPLTRNPESRGGFGTPCTPARHGACWQSGSLSKRLDMKKPDTNVKTPDTNAGAPRPRPHSSGEQIRPDNDTHPPSAPSDTATAFDRGTAAADQEARAGTVPGWDDEVVRPDGPSGDDDTTDPLP